MRKKNIIASALILTIAGIITRILGFFYRIYMTNVIGAEGIGLYQLIIPIYSLAWSISCSGFTTTISKLIAEEKAKGEYGNMGRVIKQCIFITASIGLLISLLVFFNANLISNNFLKDERTMIPLKILALSFPFMAAGSSIRGYFFGLHESVIPATSQVLEQSIRMFTVFILASSFIPKGLTYAASAAIIGIVIGEIISFLYVLISYKSFKIKKTYIKKPTLSSMATLSIILTMAIPITLNRVSSSLLMTIENALIPQRLQLFGLSASESIIAYGKITGMAVPLIYFPTAFLLALAVSLVPAVSEASAINKLNRVSPLISKSLLFTSIIGIGASGFFIVFAKELGQLIYKQDITHMLTTLGFICVFIYLQVVLVGILNGLGKQMYIFRNSIISSIITISFVYFLVPKYGIDAFIFGWFIAIAFTCISDFLKTTEILNIKIDLTNFFILPFLSSLGSSLTLNLIGKKLLISKFGDLFGVFLSIILFGLIYAFFVILSGCISVNDIKSLIKVEKKNKKQT